SSSGVTPLAPCNMCEIELCLKSVMNIKKITKSMKIVASMRLLKAQHIMQTGKQCQYGFASLEVFQNTKPEEAPKCKLFIVIFSSKVLCSSIHSSASKAMHCSINTGENSGSTDSPIVIVSEKSTAQLLHSLTSNFSLRLTLTVNQIGHDIPTFVDLIVKSGTKYDAIAIVYKRFVSAPVSSLLRQSMTFWPNSASFKAYEMEDGITKDLTKFSLANAIYAALIEKHTYEVCLQGHRGSQRLHATKGKNKAQCRLFWVL
ncbi:ATPase, F1 complex, gamma subunit domain containing protein, partial [Lactarius tabidus]